LLILGRPRWSRRIPGFPFLIYSVAFSVSSAAYMIPSTAYMIPIAAYMIPTAVVVVVVVPFVFHMYDLLVGASLGSCFYNRMRHQG
jgi:hypothetical protein